MRLVDPRADAHTQLNTSWPRLSDIEIERGHR